MGNLTRTNPRYREYLDTAYCYQVFKECPSVYGGYENVEGFEYTRLGLDGVTYYGIIPMTRSTLGTNFIGRTSIHQDCIYDFATDVPSNEVMYHRTIFPMHGMGVERLFPESNTERTIGRDYDFYASHRSISIDCLPPDIVCDPDTYLRYRESKQKYVVDDNI